MSVDPDTEGKWARVHGPFKSNNGNTVKKIRAAGFDAVSRKTDDGKFYVWARYVRPVKAVAS